VDIKRSERIAVVDNRVLLLTGDWFTHEMRFTVDDDLDDDGTTLLAR